MSLMELFSGYTGNTEKTITETHRAEIIVELQKEQAANDKYNRDPFDDRHFCHECNNLINKRCIVQRFRPVDDIPRRCSDFSQPIANKGTPPC